MSQGLQASERFSNWDLNGEYAWAADFAQRAGCLEGDALQMLRVYAAECQQRDEPRRVPRTHRKPITYYLAEAAEFIERNYTDAAPIPDNAQQFARFVVICSRVAVWAWVLAWGDQSFKRLVQRIVNDSGGKRQCESEPSEPMTK